MKLQEATSAFRRLRELVVDNAAEHGGRIDIVGCFLQIGRQKRMFVSSYTTAIPVWCFSTIHMPFKVTMKISLMDRSLYFKGLMLLIRKDRVVGEEERALMMHIGRLFSFEKGFCQEVIDGILTNRHVIDEPPLFSDPEIARCFVQDGLQLSSSDGQIHDTEWQWLKIVAEANHLDPSWYETLLQAASDQVGKDLEVELEAEHFVWE